MFEKKLKVGDKIILQNSVNGLNSWDGCLLEIVFVSTNYYSCKNLKHPEWGSGTVYIGGGYKKDAFSPADRSAQADYLAEALDKKQKECVEMAKELKDLRRFKSDEDAVAHKISEMIKTKGNVAAISHILTELKRTNFV